jgi:hypothetical protein
MIHETHNLRNIAASFAEPVWRYKSKCFKIRSRDYGKSVLGHNFNSVHFEVYI